MLPPRPLRTVQAGFLAYGSRIGQRIREDTRLPHWPWGQPGRYCDRAGYRDRRGPHQQGSLRSRRQICFAPRTGWLSVHFRQHPREVSSLSRGVISQPLSGPLQSGLRFLPRPLPAAPSTHLTARLPSREDDGLTTLHRWNPRGLGPTSTPVAHHLHRANCERPHLATHRLVQACQHLWLVRFNDAYGGSPGLAIPRAPGPRPPWCWQSPLRLTPRRPSLPMRVRCPEGFTPRRCRRRMPR